jgi:superfamily II DNA or RNA helicase
MDQLDAIALLLIVYHHQTSDEQEESTTRYRNGVGFNGTDAAWASSVAQQILAGRSLSSKQVMIVQKIMGKYQGQSGPEEIAQVRSSLPSTIIRAPSPSEAFPKEEPKKLQGALSLLPNGDLEFEPYIYPTTQLRAFGWGRGARAKFTWVHSFSLDAISSLLRTFPDISITEEVSRKKEDGEKASALPSTIEEHEQLFPYQKESIQFLLSHKKAILALSPGLGKTAAAIFAGDQMCPSSPKLVIAPWTLALNWKKEVMKWVGERAVIWHGNPSYWTIDDENWVITNYETASRNWEALREIPWELVIIDESVLIKNRKAQRTLAAKEITKEVPVVWLLSGAPTTKFYDDLWSQLNILDRKRFSSYWRFAENYCEIESNYWGTKIVGNIPEADKIIQEDLRDIFFSRTQDQVLDLPPFIFQDIEVAMSKADWEAYAKMQEEFMATLPETGEVIMAPNVLARLLRLVQLSSNPSILGGDKLSEKWRAAKECLDWCEKPAIIWTSFIETARKLKKELEKEGYKIGLLTGEVKVAERDATVAQFQAGELDIIIAHPAVGKFGLTLTRARTVIYLERSFNGDDYFQSLFRVRRIGTSHSPHIIHLLSVSPTGNFTVDHLIARILEFRKESNLKLTKGMMKEVLNGANL